MEQGLIRGRYEYEAKSWGANQKQVVQLKGQPENQRIDWMLFELLLNVTNNTGGAIGSASATSHEQLLSVVQNLDHNSDFLFVRSTGRMLYDLQRLMSGKSMQDPNDFVAINNAASANIRLLLALPLADPRQYEPRDTAIATRLLESKTFEVTFSSATTLAANVPINSGTFRTLGVMSPGNGDVVPAAVRIDYEDWNQATANVRPGSFSHFFIYDESDLAVTIGEYAQVTFALDGSPILDKVRSQFLNADFNAAVSSGSAGQVSSGISAREALPTQGGAQQFLPLIYQADKYKLTKLPSAQRSARFDIDNGSLNTARFAYRQIEHRAPDHPSMHAAARLFGIAEPHRMQVYPKTASKVSLRGPYAARHAMILPKRLGPPGLY